MKLDWWPNPVTTEGRTTIEFNVGDTLDQVLGRLSPFDNCEIAVFVNGAPVPRESWQVFVIEPNDIISARVIMTDGDGGSNPIAVVLSIAILVAAPFLAASILGTTAALVQGTIAGAALTAGIGFVGLLVINALFPPRLPDIKKAGQLPRQYSISGGANRARPYEPLLLLLGSHKLFPDLAAKEYTEYDSEGDQFLFQLFDFGIGNLDVGTLKIGATDLSDYASVMTEAGANQSLVYGDVDTVAGGEFDADNLVAISRTLGAMTTQIGFDVISQYFNVSDSDLDGLTIIFNLEYKLVTETAWTSQNVSIDTPDGAEARIPKRGTYTYEVDSGSYDVRASVMSSVSTEDTHTFQAAVNFKGYQDTTADWKGRNPLAVKIKATGQLYGRVESLNAECKQLIDHWNGSSWVANSVTSNPGDILYKYLRGWYDSDNRLIAGMGLPTNRIDEESIKLFVTFCNNNGLECNVVIEDGRDHAETMMLICQCGWGAIDLQSGKWGVIYEDFGRALSAVVNPDNVIAGSMTVVYENEALADEIIGDFIDSASEYEQNQLRRTVPNKVNPKRPTVIPLEGIVKGEHAAKELNRAVAAQAYHIRSITWEMDLAEGMPIARGDVVGVSHGLVGSGKGGRFTNIDSTRIKVTPSRSYSDSDAGSIWIWDLNNNVLSGSFTVNSSGELVLSASLPDPPIGLYDNPTAYRFMTFLTSSALEKVRIIGKEPSSSTKLRFIARDEVDDYYNYRTSDLTWTPVTRRLLGNPSSPVTAFSVSQDQNGVRIFAWALHHSRLIVRYQIRYGTLSDDFDDMTPLHDGYLISSPFESFNFPSAGSYRFGLVGLSEDGIRTSPVYRDYTFEGVTSIVGADGEDGAGIEYIFARTSNPSVPANQRPSNSWGYDAGGTSNGLTWTDGAPNLTISNPYLWRCQRDILGAPEVGSDVMDTWNSPVIVGRYGVDGDDGDDGIGEDGDDGMGVEYIFTAYSSASLPTARRPLNSWGYDSPGTRGGQLWTDGAPTLSSSNAYLYRSERSVPGSPSVGTAVSDSWSIPVIVGRYGIDGIAGVGQDGEDGIGFAGPDGIGVEYIFTARSTASLPISKRPLNSWGYDSPGTRDGQEWTDGAPTLSSSNPYLYRSERAVPGSPAVGTAVSDSWSIPTIVGRFGIDGIPGGDGEDGIGFAGPDGIGVEYIFTAYSSASFPTAKRPLNSWGYDSPGTRDGQEWHDGAPNIDSTVPFLFRSERAVPGSPAVGTAVVDSWSIPTIVGRFGNDGIAGIDGEDGEDGIGFAGPDGIGIEYIFTAYSSASLPQSRRPTNTWGYDSPGTRGGQTWYDGAPNLTNDLPFLYLSERAVPGSPDVGTAVADSWSIPVIVGRFGIDGLDGEDGGGVEFIFTVYSSSSLPTSRRPLNSWGYDSPGTRGGQTWYDGAPNLTSDLPFLYLSERAVPGSPDVGTAVVDLWSIPVIIGRLGVDGDPASRGSGWFREVVTESEQSQLGTFTVSLNSTWTARANALTPGENITNDIVTFWRGESFSSSWYWSGATWLRMLKFIGAETILAIDITAITGSFADLNVTGVLSADHIDSDVRNWRRLFSGSIAITSQSTWRSITLLESLNNFTSLFFVGAALGTNSNCTGSIMRTRIPTSSSGITNIKVCYPFVINTQRNQFAIQRVSNTTIRVRKGSGSGVGNMWIYEVWGVSSPTITPDPPTPTNIAPSWTDDTGNAQSWTEDSAISGITVPAASGTPTPTYSSSGLPAGLSFNSSTLRISGTPTSIGSGTITITATNSEGSATWTMGYTVVAMTVLLQAPGTPSTPTLSSRTTSSLTLATVPGSGGTPTLYRWRYSLNSVVSNADPMITSTTPNVTISGLNPDDQYWIDVRAENSEGESAYSGNLATSTNSISMPDIVAPSTLSVTEGSTANLNVRLSAQPTSNVVVTATESDADIAISPSSRTFTPANWNNNQVFVVTGLSDSDSVDDTATINLTASGGSTDIDSVLVTITDDDSVVSIPAPTGLTVSGTQLSVAGTSETYYVTFQYDDNNSFSSPSAEYDAFLSGLHQTNWSPPSGLTYIRARFTTAANDGGTQGAWSATITHGMTVTLQAPGTPSTPTLTSRTTNSLTLATVPGSGGTPTLYRWRYSTNSNVTNSDPMVTSTTPNVTISGLNVNDQYWIDVRAENSEGESAYSGNLATSTLAAATIPAPTGVGANSTDLSANFTSTPPAYYATFQYDNNSSFSSPATLYDTNDGGVHRVDWSPPSGLTYIRARFTTAANDGGTQGPWSQSITYGATSGNMQTINLPASVFRREAGNVIWSYTSDRASRPLIDSSLTSTNPTYFSFIRLYENGTILMGIVDNLTQDEEDVNLSLSAQFEATGEIELTVGIYSVIIDFLPTSEPYINFVTSLQFVTDVLGLSGDQAATMVLRDYTE